MCYGKARRITRIRCVALQDNTKFNVHVEIYLSCKALLLF